MLTRMHKRIWRVSSGWSKP